MPSMEYKKRTLVEEAAWLIQHPEFEERPASILEFLTPKYLGLEATVRERVKEILVDLFGLDVNPERIAKYEEAISTGAIGVGKSTLASIVIPYMAHWALCLKDPQEFYGLMPGTRIAFMLMSTSRLQARDVVYGDIQARIDASPWFQQTKYAYDPNITTQFRFPKNIWIIPGDSSERTFEGFNILGGIMDEVDSYKVTKNKDYAEQGYCVDEDTEIFTSEGWKRYDQLSVGDRVMTLNHDDGTSEWNDVEEVCVFPATPRSMIHMEGHEFSAFTTPNHRWPTTTRGQGRRWRTTETLTSEDRLILNAPRSDLPTEAKWSDDLVEAVAWAWTEGRVAANGRLSIYQMEGRNADSIRGCLTGLFGVASSRFEAVRGSAFWSERTRSSGLVYFSLSQAASRVVLEHCPEKVPRLIWLDQLTKAQLALFIDTSYKADNCGDMKLAQKNPAAADAFAHALILAGRGVSYRWIPDRVGCGYRMRLIRELKKNCVNPKMAERSNGSFCIAHVEYDGLVWCPRTRNQTWLARRDGSVYFTGNSTIHGRMTSRFQDRGFLLIIGQMKSAQGFAARHYKRLKADPKGYAVRMSIWESFGWGKYLNADGSRDSFWFDTLRMCFTTEALAAIEGFPDHMMEVPRLYEKDFITSPFKALRDLAGRPPAVTSPLFNDPTKIHDARDKWRMYWNQADGPVDFMNRIAPWFRARNSAVRVMHVDIAISGEGDALGLAMGHVPEIVMVGDEAKPFIVIDLLMRIKAAPGNEIYLGQVRQDIYRLKDKLGFNIKLLTTDGFQSTDFRQQVARRRIRTDVLSTDRTTLPYYDLHDAIMEERIAIPPYMVPLSAEQPDLVDILYTELVGLQEEANKIDHLPEGSKDVADAVACVVSNLMTLNANRSVTGNADPTAPVGDRTAGVRLPHHTIVNTEMPRAPRAPAGMGFGNPTPWRPPR